MRRKNDPVNDEHRNSSQQQEDNDALEEQKNVLKTQIHQLEELISEIEFSLNQTTYKDVEHSGVLEKPAVEHKKVYKVNNVACVLEQELFKLAGLYCIKCARHEYVINFTPFSSTRSEATYGIQFFTSDKKGTVGKYVMPTSGVMESILGETPIEQLTGLIPFFRNCKRHLDCYVDRKEQYEQLKELTSTVKNISVDADTAYVSITCCFLKAYYKPADGLVDVAVYLSYDYGKARPSMINLDWSARKKPSDNNIKEMRSFVKAFRTSTLAEAYLGIGDLNHRFFSWKPEEEDETGSININENLEDFDDEEVEVSRPTQRRKRRHSPTPESSGESEKQSSEESRPAPEPEVRPPKLKRSRKPNVQGKKPVPKSELQKQEPPTKTKQPKVQVEQEKPKAAVAKKKLAKTTERKVQSDEKESESPRVEKKKPSAKVGKPKVQREEQKPKSSVETEKAPETFKKPSLRQSTLSFAKSPTREPEKPKNSQKPKKEVKVLKKVSTRGTSTPMPKNIANKLKVLGDPGISPIVKSAKGRTRPKKKK